MPWSASGSAELQKLAIAYKDGGRKLRARTARRLREAATPLASEVVAKGAEPMPHGGGLSARLASATAGVTVSLLGQRTSVSIRIKNAEGDRIRAINRTGKVRHRVYGKGPWVDQSVPKGTYTKAFEEGAPVASKAAQVGVQEALAEIAREASS